MRKVFSGLFAAAGCVLLAVGIVLALWCQARERQVPRQAAVTAGAWMDAVSQGDLDLASSYLYGQSAPAGQPEGELQILVDRAYRDSLSCAAQSLCQAAEDGAQQTAAITVLDLSAVWDTIEAQAKPLRGEGIPAEEALLQSARTVLAGSCPTVTRNVTLHVIYRDGQWWISPDRALEKALMGQ